MYSRRPRVSRFKGLVTRRRLLVLAAAVVVVVASLFFGLRSQDEPKPAPTRKTTPEVEGEATPASDQTTGNQATPLPSTPQPTVTLPPAPTVPATILDLSNWRLTLPVNTAHEGSPDEINQPELAHFVLPPFFELTAAKNGVIFQANAGGATTKNSGYPRSELREMTNNGSKQASWSNASGTHTMVVREAITHLPVVKPEVVAAQIHDASDDVVMVKLSGNHLFVEANSDNIGDLDTNYVLGTAYTVKIVAASGRIQVYFNDVLKVDYAKSGAGFYFKAGCYIQSNTTKGDAADAYAQVVIYGLQVSHT